MSLGTGPRRIRALAALAVLVVAWRVVAIARIGPVEALRPLAPAAGRHEVRGVFHVHTRLSHDGRAEVGEIVDAARQAGIEFVYLTEHNNFGIADTGQEGWKDGVLLLSGNEAGTCDSFDPRTNQCVGGHVLLLGPPKLTEPLTNKKSEELAELTGRAGGLAFAAHPGNRRVPWRGGEGGLAGAEMLSFWSAYEDLGWTRIVPALACYPLNATYAMNLITLSAGPDLAAFDAMCRRRRLTGIAGADAHANIKVTQSRSVAFPSMSSFFRMMSTHLLLDGPFTRQLDADRKLLLGALSKGRAYAAWDSLADASGFAFTAQIRDTIHPMGSVLPRQWMTLRVTAPEAPGARVTLLRDGAPVAFADGASLVYQTTADGAFRCEVSLPFATPFLGLQERHPWILSSPIYVGDRYAQ